MAKDHTFADGVAARLTPVGPVAWRRMFGGYGVYLDGLMFGLIASDTLYLKVDDSNRPDYEDAGSAPFTYVRKGKQVEMAGYWRVPDAVWDDMEALHAWAEAAHAAAARIKAAKPSKPRKRRA